MCNRKKEKNYDIYENSLRLKQQPTPRKMIEIKDSYLSGQLSLKEARALLKDHSALAHRTNLLTVSNN